MKTKLTTGEKVKKLREERGWSQVNLCDETGISQSKISIAENIKHKEMFSEQEIICLAKCFGIPVNDVKGTPLDLNLIVAKNESIGLTETNNTLLKENIFLYKKMMEFEDNIIHEKEERFKVELENKEKDKTIMKRDMDIKNLKNELKTLKQTYNIK